MGQILVKCQVSTNVKISLPFNKFTVIAAKLKANAGIRLQRVPDCPLISRAMPVGFIIP